MMVLTISSTVRSQGLCEAGTLVKVLNVMVGLRMYVFIDEDVYCWNDIRSVALSGVAFNPS